MRPAGLLIANHAPSARDVSAKMPARADAMESVRGGLAPSPGGGSERHAQPTVAPTGGFR